jgi:peptide/nickel transport system substrate-binding protein
LLKYDEQGALQLDLAKELQISANEKEYIFTLRDNVLWHDGEPFTADDIIFTIANIQDTDWQSSYRLAFTNIKVEKLEDYKVKFTLSEPSANFLSSLTVGILPEHLWLSVPSSNATLVELNKKPIGTGPFQFASLTKDKNGNIRTMVLERNESYYDQIPYLKTLTFKFYGDYETGVQALKNDNVDGLNLLPREYWEELEKNHSLTFHQLSLPQYVAVFFNTKKNDLLKDKALRQGLTYAVDYNKILNEALNEEGQLISGPILPGYLGYTEDLTKYDYNVALANELLDKTGWLKQDGATYRTKNGTELTVNLTTVANTEYQAVAEIIKSNWETIGVKTNLEIIPKDKIKSDIIEPRNYETLLFGQIINPTLSLLALFTGCQPGVNLSVWGQY